MSVRSAEPDRRVERARAHPAGVAVSVATAAFLAVLVVFLDDVLSLFAVGSPNLAGAR